jgi:hypothetical protein
MLNALKTLAEMKFLKTDAKSLIQRFRKRARI